MNNIEGVFPRDAGASFPSSLTIDLEGKRKQGNLCFKILNVWAQG